MVRKDGQSRMDMLDWQAESFSRRVQSIHDGHELSPTPRILRQRLNPEFADWLMGWPTGWTSTEPTACDARAMALWRFRLRQDLSSLCGG